MLVEQALHTTGLGVEELPDDNALALVRPLAGRPGLEIRCHATTLYNSIFRYDGEMIVNTHVFGIPAPHAPAMHLPRRSVGDTFGTIRRASTHDGEVRQEFSVCFRGRPVGQGRPQPYLG